MKSIRVSLLVYFLLLVAVALGAASVLAYRTAVESLGEQQAERRYRLDETYKDRKREVKEKFDTELTNLARTLAGQAESRFLSTRYLRLTSLTLLTSAPLPNGHLLAATWIPQGGWVNDRSSERQFFIHPLFAKLQEQVARRIEFNEVLIPHRDDQSVLGVEYFQIDSELSKGEWRKPWMSQSLNNQPLPFDKAAFADTQLYQPVFDEFDLPSGAHVRRVLWKTPIIRARGFPNFAPPPQPSGPRSFSQRGQRGGDRNPDGTARGPAAPQSPGRERRRDDSYVTNLMIGVSCAAETDTLERALEELDRRRLEELTEAEREAAETLDALQFRLGTIALSTFIATAVGCWLLVSIGLAPLRRLTDAVGRVTPRDFRLPLGGKALPVELTPIAGRLRGTLDDLRRAFEREKHATADISHELRTPVAALMTTLGVALRKPRTAEEYRTTLEDCQGIGRQLRQLVERVMALAKIDAGSDRLRPMEFDAGELAADCAALVKPLAAERGLEVRVHCPKPAEWVTDADKLREILVNLLHNAVEYNKPGGAVDVTVQPDGDVLDVQVHDTGVGIPPEAFGHIFERFYRADPSRQDSELHAGLGLSIVKGYVEMLGGTVSVSSVVGQGSTFRVRLPRTRPEPE